MQASAKKRLAAILCCCAVVLAGIGIWLYSEYAEPTPDPILVDVTETDDIDEVDIKPVERVVVPAASLEITPNAVDSNQCIGTAPTFLVTLSQPMEKKVIEEWLHAAPPVEFSLKSTKDKLKYQLLPKKELEENTLYTFTFDPAQESGGMPARAGNSWAFQTSAGFSVKRTLPENEGTGAPVNSVVELTFTGDMKLDDLIRNVSFRPALKGDWRKTGVDTYAFLPNGGMAYDTVYEVRVKGALANARGDENLGKDYAFKFRTEQEDNEAYAYSLYDNNAYMSTERPVFSLHMNPEFQGKMTTRIFRYESVDTYAGALESQLARDPWSLEPDPELTTAGLAKVLEEKLEYYSAEWGGAGVVVLPDTLPKGLYAAEFTWDGRSLITLFQVTDLSAYAMAGSGECLFWVNDLKTGKPAGGADISLAGNPSMGKTNAQGTLQLAHSDKDGGRSAFRIQKGNDELLLMLDNSAAPEGMLATDYWRYVYVDKPLYLPEDTINFFGVVSPKLKGTKAVDKVTAVIGRAWEDDSSEIRADVSLKDGVFEGRMKLPGLSPGYYNITIYSGDTWLGGAYFEVALYQKPAYQLLLTSDQYILWAGEKANVTAKAEYFDGTPLAGLDILLDDSSMKTDAGGKAVLQVNSPRRDSTYLQSYRSVGASAELPEIGEVSSSVYFQYINNDIELEANARRSSNACNLELQAFAVDFSGYTFAEESRYDTSKYYRDFGGSLPLTVSWTKITYTKVPTGEKDYDPYTKTFIERYRYDRSEKLEGSQSVTLRGKDKQSFVLPVKDPAGEYIFEIKGKDTKGRAFERTAFYYAAAQDGGRKWVRVQDNNGKWNYAIGEEVSLSLADATTNEVYDKGTALFVRASDRLLDCTVSNNNLLKFYFDSKILPNINVYGVLFDGREYFETDYWYHRSVGLDGESRALHLEITPDKESYKPGDTAKLSLRLTDPEQNPVQGAVNLNMVDEALLSLQEQYVDINEALFNDRYFFYHSSVISHIIVSNNYDGEGGGERSDFRDTALFQTVTTDKNGKATVEVRLPDNITSWRVFWQAFRPGDVLAGSGRANIVATLPFFVDIRLADLFLASDKPILGARNAGIALDGGEVTYTVEIPTLNFKQTFNAPVSVWHALPLPELKAGEHSISVSGAYQSYADQITKKFTVTDGIADHIETQTAKLTNETRLDIPASGMARVVFADKQKAQAIQALYGITGTSSIRAEQVLAKIIAEDTLARFAGRAGDTAELKEKLARYQKDDGRIAPFSYGSAEEPATLGTTVWACAAGSKHISKGAAAGYLYGELREGIEEEDMERATLALAGLAALKEPVMQYISAYTNNSMPTEQAVNMALANTFIGNRDARRFAFDIINRSASAAGETLYFDMDSREDTLRLTANMAVAATLLDMPEGEMLFQYVLENQGVEDLYLLQQAMVLRHMAQSVNPECAEFTYTIDGNERHVKLFTSHSVLLTAEQLRGMRFSGLTDEIEASVQYSAKGFPRGDNALLSVAQKYDATLAANRTASGTITYSIAAEAPDGYYHIVHVLPSGLAFSGLDWKVEHKYAWVSEIKGQQITFTVWKEKAARAGTIKFLARPVMTGSFQSEGTYIALPGKWNFSNQVKGGAVVIK